MDTAAAITAATITTAPTATTATASTVSVNTGFTSPDTRPVNSTSLVVPVAQPSTIATSIADPPLVFENNLTMDNRVDINNVEPGKSSRLEPIDQQIAHSTAAYTTGRSLNIVNATTVSSGQSAAKAGYGTLNLVKKPLHTQDSSATVHVPIPAKGLSNHAVEENGYTAAEDARIVEVVMSVLQNSSKTNNAWEKLATELGRCVLSLKNRWLQIFKAKRHLGRNTCRPGLAELLKAKATTPAPSVAEIGDPIIVEKVTHPTTLSHGYTESTDIANPSKQSYCDKDHNEIIVKSCSAVVKLPETSGTTEGCTIKLALSPLQLDRAENPNRAVVFPSRENLHDSYVDSESGDYW